MFPHYFNARTAYPHVPVPELVLIAAVMEDCEPLVIESSHGGNDPVEPILILAVALPIEPGEKVPEPNLASPQNTIRPLAVVLKLADVILVEPPCPCELVSIVVKKPG
jgi:hypothetical protein